MADAVANLSPAARHDGDLLRRFARDRDEAAFAEVVQRHAGLVHAAARRQANDVGRAEDVAQAAFIVLAKKAGRLTRHATVGPWLLKTVRYAAANANRIDRRRRRHESAAAGEPAMRSDHAAGPDPAEVLAWREIRPILDDCVLKLSRDDQTAVVLRHFEGRGIDEVAAALGVSRDAAKQRVSRATGRLRDLLDRRGVSLATTTLAGLLAAHAAGRVPAHLVHAATRAALLPASGAASFLIAKGAMTSMHATHLKLAAALVGAGLLGSAAVVTYGQEGDGSAKPAATASAQPADEAATAAPPTTQALADRDARRRQADALKDAIDAYAEANLRLPTSLDDVAAYWSAEGERQVKRIGGEYISSDVEAPRFEPGRFLYREVEFARHLNAGDVVKVSIRDFPLPGQMSSEEYRLSNAGTISLPDVGPVKVAGATPDAAAQRLSDALVEAGIVQKGFKPASLLLLIPADADEQGKGPDLTPVVLLEREPDAAGGRFAVTAAGNIRYVVDARTLEELDAEFAAQEE